MLDLTQQITLTAEDLEVTKSGMECNEGLFRYGLYDWGIFCLTQIYGKHDKFRSITTTLKSYLEHTLPVLVGLCGFDVVRVNSENDFVYFYSGHSYNEIQYKHYFTHPTLAKLINTHTLRLSGNEIEVAG